MKINSVNLAVSGKDDFRENLTQLTKQLEKIQERIVQLQNGAVEPEQAEDTTKRNKHVPAAEKKSMALDEIARLKKQAEEIKERINALYKKAKHPAALTQTTQNPAAVFEKKEE